MKALCWHDKNDVVANDLASKTKPAAGGRTAVTGQYEGISIEVIIGIDGHTIVTGYPL